tara:strand:- start:360 stop:2117 length:1758 start_codon:yes stop_codon:yes gene_type:complete
MDSNWTMDGGYTVLMDFRDSDANLGDNWTGSDTEPFITRYASNERFRWRIGSLDCLTGGDGSLGQGYNPDTLANYGEENYWLHVAFIRTNNSLVGYQNGIAGTAVTDNHNYNTNDYGITIGRSARHITSGTGRVYGPYVGTSPTWTYGDGLLAGGHFTNWNQRDDYRRDYGVAGQIQDIRITKAARTAPALDGSYMGAPYDNPLEHSDGGVTHTPSATGVAGSGYPQATSTLVATDEAISDLVYAAPTNVTVSNCFHSPAHTGSQTSADAGLVVGSASGDVNITPPSAWEGDTVTAAVTASDGVNILNKNIQWIVRADRDANWEKYAFIFNFQNNWYDTRAAATATTAHVHTSFSSSVFPNSNYTHSLYTNRQGAGPISGGYITGTNSVMNTMTATMPWTWECYLRSNAATDWTQSGGGGANPWARVWAPDSTIGAAIRHNTASPGWIGLSNSHVGNTIGDECGLARGTDFSYGTWNHWCWQYDGTDTKSFVNGSVIRTKANTNIFWVAHNSTAWSQSEGFQLFRYSQALDSNNPAYYSPICYMTNLRFCVGVAVYPMTGFTNAPIITNPKPFGEQFGGYVGGGT